MTVKYRRNERFGRTDATLVIFLFFYRRFLCKVTVIENNIIHLFGRLFFDDHFHFEALSGFQKGGALLLVRQEIRQKSQTIGRQQQDGVRCQLEKSK